MSWNLAGSLVTDESYLTLSSWMFSVIYILKFPTFYKNLCKYYCSQLRRHKFLWKIYFKMLSWYELAIPILYATSSTFSFLQNIVRSLKRNLDDFQVHLVDELQYRFNYSLRLRQLKIIRKFHAFCLNMSRRLLLASGGVSPCQQRLNFSCWILAYLRKTLLESSEIFVEHTRQVARIWFRTQACDCDSGLGYVHRIINKWMLALEKNSLTRENKID